MKTELSCMLLLCKQGILSVTQTHHNHIPVPTVATDYEYKCLLYTLVRWVRNQRRE